MKDTQKVEGMKLLDKLTTLCYLGNNPAMPLIICRSLRWTMRYGLSEFSPPAFALMGLILNGVLFDFTAGAVYAKHSILLIEKLKSKSTEARTLFVANYFVLSWTEPLHNILKPLSRAYEVGMQTGDTDSALWAIWGLVHAALMAGRHLEKLELDHRMYFKQSEELQRDSQRHSLAITWQFILNLMGRSDNPTVLTGEAMEEESMRTTLSRQEYQSTNKVLHGIKVILYTIFGEYERGAELALSLGDSPLKVCPSSKFLWHTIYFIRFRFSGALIKSVCLQAYGSQLISFCVVYLASPWLKRRESSSIRNAPKTP